MDVQDIHFDMMFPNFDHDYLCGEIGGMDLEFDPTQWSWSNLKTLWQVVWQTKGEIITGYIVKDDIVIGLYDIEDAVMNKK